MFCPKCGANLPEGSIFCANCGFNLTNGFDTPASPVVYPLDKAKKTLSDPLFLAIAIILTVAAGAKLLVAGLDILLILTVVGVWLAYAGATGENTGLIGTGINLASVSVKIQYVLSYVAAGFVFFGGFILFVCFASIGDSLGELFAEILAVVEQTVHETGVSLEETSEILRILEKVLSVLGGFTGAMIGILCMVACILLGGIAILWNVLFTGRFSKFLSKANRACKEGREVVIGDRRCANWILAYGIITAVETVFIFVANDNIFALVCNGCLAAACIMASVMMKKEVE